MDRHQHAIVLTGFVKNYLDQKIQNPVENYDPKSVMHYFTPDQVPMLSTLAKRFAVCDHWFEPQYYSDFGHPENDQHPPSVVTLGEQLIADVYNCLRSSRVWLKTMLIVTYDEHGGCYDHVAPPTAVPPEPAIPAQTFGFDRYGVRVPAVIVSPYVKPGTIFGKSSAVPYDHTGPALMEAMSCASHW